MNPASPLFAIAVTVVAYATAWVLVRFEAVPLPSHRFETVDGLRGYLALFVVLHHACIWYFYLRTDVWTTPPSNLYTHFGQSSVALFFMVTGLLFFSKVLEARSRPIDWTRLFIGRLLRLFPLYLVAVAMVVLLVFAVSDWTLNEPFSRLVRNVGKWLAFTVGGSPNINGVNQTSLIVAGVTWSLPYEWFFYLALPVIALFVNRRGAWPSLMLSVTSIVYLVFWHPRAEHLASFLGGLMAAVLVQRPVVRRWCRSGWMSVLVLCLLGAVVLCFSDVFHWTAIALLACAFTLIAGGCSLFGLLTRPASRLLGELTYSMYLLHGVGLFVLFRMWIGAHEAARWSPGEHWGMVLVLTPLLIAMCHVTFRCIEQPAIRSTASATAAVRLLFSRVSRVQV